MFFNNSAKFVSSDVYYTWKMSHSSASFILLQRLDSLCCLVWAYFSRLILALSGAHVWAHLVAKFSLMDAYMEIVMVALLIQSGIDWGQKRSQIRARESYFFKPALAKYVNFFSIVFWKFTSLRQLSSISHRIGFPEFRQKSVNIKAINVWF